jgi:FLYWCH zinc finger domain
MQLYNRDDMETVQSQKDHTNVIHNGYRFRKDRVNADGTISWRCVIKVCKGRVQGDSTGTVSTLTDHDHPPDPEGIMATKVVADIRHRAVSTVEKPCQITRQCSSGIPVASASTVPSYAASQRVIERKRKKSWSANNSHELTARH